MKKQDLDRWYRVTMDSGPFSVGANEYDLVRDVRDCCRRGVDFVVTWHDTSDEAYSGFLGSLILDEQERCIEMARHYADRKNRDASRNRAKGLADLKLDEQGAKE